MQFPTTGTGGGRFGREDGDLSLGHGRSKAPVNLRGDLSGKWLCEL